ncbi:hypothetical protein E2C01_098435 [Portunus trituberculatus]|uniref:Uncharacterized protein n=1 Tax=Portunus trituberculatus TaxID=210409 RepID=A0A5B7K6Z7_PORTR|nr:hypothetical protein [Portunus trituberculatus]
METGPHEHPGPVKLQLDRVADVGTVHVGGQSLARELVFKVCKMFSAEALLCGFVSQVFSVRIPVRWVWYVGGSRCGGRRWHSG